MLWNSLKTRQALKKPHQQRLQIAAKRAQYRPHLELLEDRLVPAAYVFVDFGDNFPIFPSPNGPQRILTTTVGAVRDVATAQLDASNNPIPFTVIQGPQLTDSTPGTPATRYADSTAVNLTRFNFATDQRTQIMQMVRRAFASVNVRVVELTSTTQTLPDGRSVAAATNMGSITATMRGNNTDSSDVYIIAATPAIGPSNDNPNNFANNAYGGIAPTGTVLGETTDLQSALNNHDDLALAFTVDSVNFVANTIVHEAGHALGLRHSITNPAPSTTNINNAIHSSEVMSYLSSESSEFFFTRFPMVRGDSNTPATGTAPFSNNDLQARQGQVTPFDQLRVDPNVGPNPQRHFISGTGAHDVITISDGGPQGIRVTVRAFADAAHTIPIRVPGRLSIGTLPLFSYSYNLAPDRGILIEAGPGDDVIDLSVGATTITLNAGSGNDVINLNTGGRVLAVNGEDGDDTINVNFLARGMDSVDFDGGNGHDQFRFSPTLGSLNNIQSSVNVNGLLSFGNDEIWLNDSNATNGNRSYYVTDSEIRLPGRNATIFYNAVGRIELSASSAPGSTATIAATEIGTNVIIDGAATVNVGGPHPNPLIGGTFTDPIQGRLEIRNSTRPTELIVTDTGNSVPRSVTLEDRRVVGMTGEPIVFGSTLFGQNSRLSSLTINAGSGGNQVVVENTLTSARVGPITLNTGLGADTVRVEEMHTPVTINGQRGRDTVNVGRSGNLDGIAETLLVTNMGNWTDVNLDDRNDTTSDAVTMQSSGLYTVLTGLSPGSIRLRSRDLASLNIMAGTGDNGFTIDNTPASTIPGGATTTITTSTGNDMFGIRRTRGGLTINAMGGSNTFNVGSFPVGSLNAIDGTIRLSGTGGYNGLSISDDYTTPTLAMPTYSYIVDDDVIQRTDKAAIYYQDMTGINLFTSQAPDNVTVRGTKADLNPGDFTYIGTTVFGESDTVTVESTTGTLYLAAGNQSLITVGTPTSSLDNIQGLIRISPSLNNGMTLRLNDTTTPGHRLATLSGTATSQTIQRAVGESPWRTLIQVNNVPVSNVEYQSSSGGTTFFVDSSSPNTTTTLYGHAGALDTFALGFAGNMNQMQGTVISAGQSVDYDFAYYYEYLNPSPQSFTVSTHIFFPHLMHVDRPGIASMIFTGLNQVVFYTPLVGGSSVNVQGVPAELFLNMAAGEDDVVTLGSVAPNLGGSLARIQGPVQVGSYQYTLPGGGDDLPLSYRGAVTLRIDNSEDASPRQATLDVYNSPPNYYESLVGLAPAGIYWNLGPRSSVSISGGNANDSFALRSTDFVTPIFLDGGDGIDTLDYSALNTGVTVNFPAQTASGLDDGFAGFDNVIGSAGNDILVGFGGNVLSGGDGRDLLIAGSFASILNGGDGDDLLIGGATDYDTNESALDAIMTEWSRTDIGYNARVANLLNGNGVPVLNANTVHRNGGLNQLMGGLGNDLFFAQLATELLDLAGEEEMWIPI